MFSRITVIRVAFRFSVPYDPEKTLKDLAMETVLNLLQELKPPKLKTEALTWKSFYTQKGFAEISSVELLSALEFLDEELGMTLAELDEFRSSDEDDAVAMLEDLEDLRHHLTHLFRIIMALVELPTECQSALSEILTAWDFSLWPELSDDISAAVKLRPQVLEPTLREELPHVLGDVENSIIKTNAILTALAGGGDNTTLFNVIKNFHEYHPENIMVCLLSLYPQWREHEEFQASLQEILAVRYIDYLGLSADTFAVTSSLSYLSMASWAQRKSFDMASLTQTWRWFGIMGRWEFFYFTLLGLVLSGTGTIHDIFASELEDMDTLPLELYSKEFVELCEAKADIVQRRFLESSADARNLLKPCEDMDSAVRARIVLLNNSHFLAPFTEDVFAANDFLNTLRELDKKVELQEGEAPIISLSEEVQQIWTTRYPDFLRQCKEELVFHPEPVNFKKILRDNAIQVV